MYPFQNIDIVTYGKLRKKYTTDSDNSPIKVDNSMKIAKQYKARQENSIEDAK